MHYHLQEYYPEAYLDDKIFVLPNALQQWNGNIVGLQKGSRPVHFVLGMCPWGTINAAKTEVQAMTLHIPRCALSGPCGLSKAKRLLIHPSSSPIPTDNL